MSKSSPHRELQTNETHIPGEEGTWVFILGDLLVFSLMFAVYLYYRAFDLQTFLSAQQHLNPTFGAVNTLLLLTSSLCIALSLQSLRKQDTQEARIYLAAGWILGFAFVVVKWFEYRAKIDQGFTLMSDPFFMFYYAMTGIHLLHVLIGLAILLWLFHHINGDTNQKKPNVNLFEGGACFWHMVDLLWIILFPLLYLIH